MSYIPKYIDNEQSYELAYSAIQLSLVYLDKDKGKCAIHKN